MTGTVRVALPVVVVFLCLCAGFGVGGVTGESGSSPAAAGPSTDRALNTTSPLPGETVRVNTTVTPESTGPVDIFDEFSPAFAEQVSLVSVTVDGTPVSEDILIAYPESITASVSGVDAGATVVFTYDVVVPETASPGDSYTFDGLAQTEGTADPVSVGGESQLTVESPAPTFGVSLSSVPASVTTGETLTVAATVSNAGSVGGTQQVGFLVDGDRQASTPVTLDTSQTETVTFNYTVAQADAPELNVSVASANETATETVTVTEQAVFEVTLSSVPATVTVGENLTVEAVVTNGGDETATQQVSFAVDGQTETSTAVTLDGGVSETVTFEYTVGPSDTPELNVSVTSANETATETVTVTEQAVFEVSLSSVPAAVTVGENLTVTANITNVGNGAGTQPVSFAVDGDQTDEAAVALASGASETVAFGYIVDTSETPSVNVSVTSANETASETVAVAKRTFFDVTLSSVPAAVTTGENLTVVATVTNAGDLVGTQQVSLAIDGAVVTSTDLTLGGGASETVTFEYTVAQADAPELNLSVGSANATATETVTVTGQAVFEVTLSSVPAAVPVGESLSVVAVVTNVGNETGTQPVSFTVDGAVVTSTDLTLAGGASETVTFGYDVAETDTPELNVSVASKNGTASETVAVSERAFFGVTLQSLPGSVPVGDQLRVEAAVTNVGDETGTQSVTFAVDGEQVGGREVTLPAGETTTVSAEYTPVEADTPGLTLSVSSDNETTTESVSVTGETVFELELTSVPQSVRPGETLTLGVAVTNTGETAGTQSVTFAVDDERVEDRQVTLAGNESRRLTFEYTVPGTNITEPVATVTSTDDVVVARPTVLDPPALEVQSVSVDQPVVAGEESSVTATVTNTGEVTAAQSVRFDIDGTTRVSETIDVAAGASETVPVTYTPTDTGQLELVVASDDEVATETVTVLSPAAFVLTVISIDNTVTTDGTVTGTYRVENTGDIGATQTVTLRVGGDPVTNETLTLGGGERTLVRFNHTVTASGPSTLEFRVETSSAVVSDVVTVIKDDRKTNRTDDGDMSGPGFGSATFALGVVCLGLLLLVRRRLDVRR